MIGVVAKPSDHDVVREYFELFKTPWEFCRSQRRYEAVVCAGELDREVAAKVILVYAGRELSHDTAVGTRVIAHRGANPCSVSQGKRVPLYGDSVCFETPDPQGSWDTDQRTLVYTASVASDTIVRIGYDLFAEIRSLLTAGQPVENAASPTLDLHIALMRELIVANGGSLVEIPPFPSGFQFVACLTHDVDHPMVRRHRLDHTILGFLYRATVGSTVKLLRRRLSLSGWKTNWLAVLKLPLVYLGLAEDFWLRFDRYRHLEKGVPSTFFVIPFEGDPGRTEQGRAPFQRASPYAAGDISSQLNRLAAAGCEIGLHGINAWRDSESASEELAEVRRSAQSETRGVRMHWLYFDPDSPRRLEDAGLEYDSTVGYNETVGFRAGTAQVFKPLSCTRLLELPMHVMDTALFYPKCLGVEPREARTLVRRIFDQAEAHGGCVTVNWHDRSIAPERLWGDFYEELVTELKGRRAWLATGSQVVAWFRMRRSARFHESNTGAVEVSFDATIQQDLPPLQTQQHGGTDSAKTRDIQCTAYA